MKNKTLSAQNSGTTAEAKPRGRPFKKGQSGNPGGRPKGLASLIQEMTNDGEDLANFMLQVFRGEVEDAKLKDRIDATTWLADRAFGRPSMTLPVQEHPEDLGVIILPAVNGKIVHPGDEVP